MGKFGDGDRGGRGPGKPYSGGGKPYGAGKSSGGGKPYGGGGGKPYGGGGGGKSFGGPKPYGARAEGAAKPWVKRDDAVGDRPRGPKVERFGRDERPTGAGDGERRPFQRREGGNGPRPPFQRREGGDGPRPPFQRREGGDGPRPPFQRREGGDGERRPFQRREGGYANEGGQRPPKRFADPDGYVRPTPAYNEADKPRGKFGDSDRPRRSFGDSDRPKRNYGDAADRPRRSFGDSDRPRKSYGDRDDKRGPRKSDTRDAAREIPTGHEELRQHGWNACMATWRLRPDAVRKVYLHSSRIDALRETLQELADRQIGYRIVENDDLEKLAQTQHHEGVCFDVIPPPVLSLDDALATAASAPHAWFVWLDGVGNPHNLGAILRSAAHFGCAGVIVHRDANLKVSGAAARVAEGGAEVVPLVRIGDTRGAVEKLRGAGFELLATSVRDGGNLFDAELPSKLVWLMGAEGEGVSSSMQELADRQLQIPGTGKIESLNVAAAFAVFAAETCRSQR